MAQIIFNISALVVFLFLGMIWDAKDGFNLMIKTVLILLTIYGSFLLYPLVAGFFAT